MARRAGGWTCRRQTAGVICRHENRPRTRLCAVCGKSRPAKRRPAHTKALDVPYEKYIKLTGGEFCSVCKRAPSPGRRLDRDHCHGTGKPRGLLCSRCNRALPNWMTPAWLDAAADYLRRTA